MKQSKIQRYTLFALMALGVWNFSCKDDFSEEALLESQVELAEQQEVDKTARLAESLNTTGELLSYSVKVVSSNNQPVAGANISLEAAAQGEADVQTLTTDANGEAFFGRAVIGGNTLSISAEGYFDVIASIDFGTIEQGQHYQVIDGLVVPTPVTESSIIPLFSNANGSETATITGMVTIETDLTNTTPEVPQDLTLQANLSNFANQFNIGGSIDIDVYTFSDNVTIGSTIVDNTTGTYTLKVPATLEGIEIGVLVPNLSANQTLAITSRNGFELERPEYAQVPTNFGPDWDADSNIPYVPGAIWVFDEPAPAGSGFDLNYEKIGRGFQDILFTTYDFVDYVDPAPLTVGPGFEETIIQTTSFGSNLINAPLFNVIDPTGENAVGVVNLEFAIDALALSQTGSGFNPNQPVDFNLYYDVRFYKNENGVLVIDEALNNIDLGIDLDVMTDENGTITQANIEAALADILNQQFIPDGFDPENPYSIPGGAGQFNLRFQSDSNNDANTCVIGIARVSVGRAESFQLWTPDNSDGYTDPTFEFYGGAGEVGFTLPSLKVVSFGTQWQVTPNNDNVTAPYTLPPSAVAMEYFPVSTTFPKTPEQETELLNENDSSFEIVGLLEADANGNLQFVDQLSMFKTPFYSDAAPKTLLVEPQSLKANVDIGFLSVDENGSITSFDLDNTIYGEGYTDQFEVQIEPAAEGAPGSEAQVDLVGGQFAPNGEYQWDGDYEIKSGGSGYLKNLNQKSSQAYEGNFNQPVIVGQDYILNIRYGTGQRQEIVN